jgi:hypothetical protein
MCFEYDGCGCGSILQSVVAIAFSLAVPFENQFGHTVHSALRLHRLTSAQTLRNSNFQK